MLDSDGSVHSFIESVRQLCIRHAPNEFVRYHSTHAPAKQWSFWKDFGYDSPTAIDLINNNVTEAFSFPITASNRAFLHSANRIPGLRVVTSPWGKGAVLEECMEAKTKWFRDAGFRGEIVFSEDKTGDWDLVIEDDPFHAAKAVANGSKVLFVTLPVNLPGAPVCIEAVLDENSITRVPWNELTFRSVKQMLPELPSKFDTV